jgi:hypothetical protein
VINTHLSFSFIFISAPIPHTAVTLQPNSGNVKAVKTSKSCHICAPGSVLNSGSVRILVVKPWFKPDAPPRTAPSACFFSASFSPHFSAFFSGASARIGKVDGTPDLSGRRAAFYDVLPDKSGVPVAVSTCAPFFPPTGKPFALGDHSRLNQRL